MHMNRVCEPYCFWKSGCSGPIAGQPSSSGEVGTQEKVLHDTDSHVTAFVDVDHLNC